MTQIRLYDTMAREKRVFEPADPKRVTMYVCGPTVYNRAHIGNARPAVIFDRTNPGRTTMTCTPVPWRSTARPCDHSDSAAFDDLVRVYGPRMLAVALNLGCIACALIVASLRPEQLRTPILAGVLALLTLGPALNAIVLLTERDTGA